MNLFVIDVGDLHAELWRKLNIWDRRINGCHDVTTGEHPNLGMCIISHFGHDSRVVWLVERAMKTACASKLAWRSPAWREVSPS